MTLYMGGVPITSSNPMPMQDIALNPSGTPTGVITVATAGSPQQGADIANLNGFVIKANPANTGIFYIFGTGQTYTTGFPLSAGDMIYVPVADLNTLWFDVSVSGEKAAWIKQ